MDYDDLFAPVYFEPWNDFISDKVTEMILPGGRGCVSADTLIDTPSGKVRIDEFCGGIVYSFDGRNIVEAEACRPILYSEEDLYEVMTDDGNVINCTDEHRFLTHDGWKMLKDIKRGERVVSLASCSSSSHVQQDPSTGKMRGLKVSYGLQEKHYAEYRKAYCEDVLRSTRRLLGSIYRCSHDFRLCGGRPPLEGETYLDAFLRLAGVHAHTPSGSRMDGQACECKHIPVDQRVFRRSKTDSYRHGAKTVQDCESAENGSGQGFSESPLESFLDAVQSLPYKDLLAEVREFRKAYSRCENDGKCRERILQGFYRLLLCRVDDASFSDSIRLVNEDGMNPNLRYNKIIGVKLKRRERYWDMFVPFYNNYIAGGFVNHNSAKSSFASMCMVAGVCAHPGTNAIVFRKHQTDIRDSVYNQVLWAIDKLGLVDLFAFSVSPAKMVLKATGQTIYFYGLDDPRKRKSIKPTRGYFRYLWMEEWDQFDGMPEVRSIRQSVFRGGPIYQSIYSFNPPASAASWANAEAARAVPGRKVYRTSYLDIAKTHPDWLGEGFIREADEVRKSNEQIYRHEYLGEATGTGGEIFTNLEARPIDVAELRASDKVKFFNGLDFGFTNDPTVLVQGAYDAALRTVYVFDEWYHHGPYVDDCVKAVKDRGLEDAVIIGDRAADLAIKEMNRKGCHVRPCYKSPNGWRDDGIRWMRTRAKIVIDSGRCPNAWREMSQYEFARYANGDFKTEYPDGNDHVEDAIRYGCEPFITAEMRPVKIAMPQGFRRGGFGGPAGREF